MSGRDVRGVRARVGLALAVVLCAGPAWGAGLGDLFRSPDERAARALESEAGRAALAASGDTEWTGHARYVEGNPAAAAAAFEATLAEESDPDERHRLRYNRATALVRAGRYDEAIAAFDALLDDVPDDADAAANRDVARRLAALEPSPSSSDGQEDTGEREGESADGSQDGSRKESGDPADPSGQDAQGGAGEADESGDVDEPGEAEQASNGTGNPADAAQGDAESMNGLEGSTDAERAAADAALDASQEPGDALADAEEPAEGDRRNKPDGPIRPADTPLDEREQAIEQWLRNIPDDPAGLLRRKLVQSHRRDWPDVRRDGDAW